MDKFRKKQQISALEVGEQIDDVFVVKIKRGMSEYVKGFRFNLLVSDNSGRTLEYVYWGPKDENAVKEIYNSIKSDSVVRIQGKVSSYNDKLQLATNAPFKIEVLTEDQYEKEDFVRPSKKDLTEMYTELLNSINLIDDEKIKILLINIFHDEIISNKFKQHPGAIEIHHNWIGGLLEHTLEVLKYAKLSLEQFPTLNKDLLIAGALLHDIGKLEELEITSRIKGTNIGQLNGHLVLGMIYVAKKIEEIPDFNKEIKTKILHMLASHHGKNEFGSPKEPMFPEALAIYYADELSSKLSEMTEFIASAKDETEDDFMYSRRKSGNIFLK
jgi:3'-5' exoribonuclease